MRTHLAALSAALLITAVRIPAQDSRPANAALEGISSLVTQKMSEYDIPGAAFGVLKNGEVTLRGFGITNIDNAQPMTPDTVFPIASMSKTVTAMALVRLAEQGKVDLEAPVGRYLSDFAVQDPGATRDIAIWHLLTHTPGWEGQLSGEDRGVESLTHFAASQTALPQLAAPGAVWSYNNAGFTIGGRVIEVVTGKRIHEALRELVIQPLGLRRTFSRTEEAVTYRFAAAHRCRCWFMSLVKPM